MFAIVFNTIRNDCSTFKFMLLKTKCSHLAILLFGQYNQLVQPSNALIIDNC
jgi:hypothetical protein